MPGISAALWDNRNGPESACNTIRGLTRSTGLIREGLPDMVPKICTFEGCEKLRHHVDLCNAHGRQRRKGQELRPLKVKYTNLSELLDAHTDRTGDCWIWLRAKDHLGYGRQRWDGRDWLVHRLSYANHYGPIPEGLLVDHACRNPQCIKPSHLRLATQKQNQENLARLNSASGYLGVSKESNRSTWKAEVTHNYVRYGKYGFPTPELAAAAAREMRLSLFTHNIADRIEKGAA